MKQIQVLYRSVPIGQSYHYNPENITNAKMLCPDTGKTGIYFTPSLFYAMAMSWEYHNQLELLVFRVEGSLGDIRDGKYSKSEGRHFDEDMGPIIEFEECNGSRGTFVNTCDRANPEIFLVDNSDLQKLVLTYTFAINEKMLIKKAKELLTFEPCLPGFSYGYLQALTFDVKKYPGSGGYLDMLGRECAFRDYAFRLINKRGGKGKFSYLDPKTHSYNVGNFIYRSNRYMSIDTDNNDTPDIVIQPTTIIFVFTGPIYVPFHFSEFEAQTVVQIIE